MAECVILVRETDTEIVWELDDATKDAIKDKTPIAVPVRSVTFAASGLFDEATRKYCHSEGVEEVSVPHTLTSMKLIDFESVFGFDELVFQDADTKKEIKRVEI